MLIFRSLYTRAQVKELLRAIGTTEPPPSRNKAVFIAYANGDLGKIVQSGDKSTYGTTLFELTITRDNKTEAPDKGQSASAARDKGQSGG